MDKVPEENGTQAERRKWRNASGNAPEYEQGIVSMMQGRDAGFISSVIVFFSFSFPRTHLLGLSGCAGNKL